LGDSATRAKAHFQKLAEAESVTVAGGRRGDAGAIFAPAPIVGAVSDGCAAMAG